MEDGADLTENIWKVLVTYQEAHPERGGDNTVDSLRALAVVVMNIMKNSQVEMSKCRMVFDDFLDKAIDESKIRAN